MTHHSVDVSPRRDRGEAGGGRGRDPGHEEDAEGTRGCRRADPSPVCSGVKMSSGDKPLRCANFLKASRASGFTSGFLPAGQVPGESGLEGHPEGQEGSVWSGRRAGAEETGPSQPEGPGERGGTAPGDTQVPGGLGGHPRTDPRATCRIRPLTWKGSPPRGTALPSDQRTLAFTPVRVPAPRTPPSASPASGSGARNVPPERSVGPEGTVCLHRPLGAQGPARGPACAMPSSAAPSEMQRPWAEKGCCRAAGPLGQRRGQAGRGDSLKSLAALNLPASNGPSQ